MQFAVISPTNGLTRYSKLSNYHLLLPQVENPNYWAFYRERREAGDFLILDNGAYEQKEAWTRYFHELHNVRPQVAVLPDFYLQEGKKTIEACAEFLRRWNHLGKELGIQWMFCPQAPPGKPTEFIDTLLWGLDHPSISWIALPRALVTHISPDPLMRANLCEWITSKTTKKVHALGMARGSLGELRFLAQGRCSGIDSSAPVWRGWKGLSLVDTSGHDAVPDVDFSALDTPEPNDARDRQILENLEAVGVSTIRYSSGVSAGATD